MPFRLMFITLILSSYSAMFAQYTGSAPYIGERGGLIINELSNGTTGSEEYVELVVVGAPSNPSAAVDLTGFIIDDNNLGQSGVGTAAGYMELTSAYNAVNPGSILLIYNSGDRNPLIPADDPNDSNGDDIYIIPSNHSNISGCYSNPNSGSGTFPASSEHCPCIDPTASFSDWPVGIRNGGDLMQVIDPCGTVQHVLSYGLSTGQMDPDVPASNMWVSLTGGSNTVWYFNDGDWSNVTNYTQATAGAPNETPAAANNATNQTFITNIATSSPPAHSGGVIERCEETDAGDLNWPTDASFKDNDTSTTDIVELCQGEDLMNFTNDYSQSDELQPPGSFAGVNFEYAFILTEATPPYTIIAFNTSGDFDLSSLTSGRTYKIWGFSYIQTSGSPDVIAFLHGINNISEIQSFSTCGYHGDVDEFDPSGNTLTIEIEEPQDLTPPAIGPFCASDPDFPLPTTVDGATGTWSGTGVNGNVFEIQTQSLTPGTYNLVFTPDPGSCANVIDPVEIEILDAPMASTPAAIDICLEPGTTSTSFNLTNLNSTILGGGSGTVNWYEDAAKTIPIGTPSNYTLTGTPPTSISVFATVSDGTCESMVVTVTFNLLASPDYANIPAQIDCRSLPFTVDLTTFESSIGSTGSISWLDNAFNPISTPSNHTITNELDSVFFENTASNGCTTVEAIFFFTDTPPTGNLITIPDVCADSFTNYDLTVWNSSISSETITWYNGDPDGSGTVISNPMSADLTGVDFWVLIGDPPCQSKLDINNPNSIAIPTANTPAMQEICLPFGTNTINVDLTVYNATVLGGASGSVNWYLNINKTTSIIDPTNFLLSGPGMISVFAAVDDGRCESTAVTLVFNLIASPGINSGVTIDTCGSLPLTIDLSNYENNLITTTGTVEWYINPGGNPILSPNIFSVGANPTTIYASVHSTTSSCASDTVAVTINVNMPPSFSVTSPITICEGSGIDLTAQVNPPTGINYTFFETTPPAAPISNPTSYAPTASGTVFVVGDVGGCENTQQTTINVNPEPSFTATPDITVCEGLVVDLPVLANPDNGSLTYTYHTSSPANSGNQISNPNTFVFTTPPSSTTITILGTDPTTGCSTEVNMNVTVVDVPFPPTINIMPSNTVCEGDMVTLTASYSIPIPGVNFEWTLPDGSTFTGSTLSFTADPNIHNGIFSVVGTLLGCSSTPATINLTVNPVPNAPDITGPNSLCEGESITISAPAGVNFTIADPSIINIDPATGVVTGIAAGTTTINYTITQAGCTNTSNDFTITVNPSPTLDCASLTASATSSPGASDGSLEFPWTGGAVDVTLTCVAGGCTDFTFTGLNGNPILINNLPAGTYKITLTDPINGCSSNTCTFTINDPSCSLNLSTTTITPVNCFGGSDGSFEFNVTGASGAVEYLLDGNPISPMGNRVENLTAGFYTFTVRETANPSCSQQITVLITEPFELSITSCNDINIDPSQTSALVNIAWTGGTPSYTLLYDDGSGTTNVGVFPGGSFSSTLGVGTHTYIVVDANGCRDTCTFAITQSNCVLSIDNIQETSSIACHGDSTAELFATISSGTPSFSWYDSNDILVGNTNPISNLPAGDYYLIIDDGSCQDTMNYTISEPDELIIDCSNTTNASGPRFPDGSINLGISGGTSPFEINWRGVGVVNSISTTQNVQLIPDLIPGNYDVIVTDANGCMDSCMFEITDECNFEIACADGFVSACGNSGQGNISFINGATSINHLYLFDSSYLFLDSLIFISDRDTFFSNLAAGSYIVIGANDSGCEDTCSFDIIAQDSIHFNIDSISIQDCDNDLISIDFSTTNASPNVVYIIGSDTTHLTSFDSIPQGTIRLQALDTLTACLVDTIFDYSLPDFGIFCSVDSQLTADSASDGQGRFYTFGNVTTTILNSGITTTVNGDTTILQNLPRGIYEIEVTHNVTGCRDTCSFQIFFSACDLTLDSVSAQFLGCPSDSTLSIQTALSGSVNPDDIIFIWNDADTLNSGTQANLPAGIYKIAVLDTNTLCKDSLIFDFTHEPLAIDLDSFYFEGCEEDSMLTLIIEVESPTVNTVYIWGTDTTDQLSYKLQGLNTSIEVIALDTNTGCSSNITVGPISYTATSLSCSVISAPTAGNSDGRISANLNGLSGIYAFRLVGPGIDSTQNVTPPFTFDVSNLGSGLYQYIVTNPYGCSDTCSVELIEQNCVFGSVSLMTSPQRCESLGTASIDLPNPSSDYNFDWNIDSLDGNNTAELLSGTYTVTVQRLSDGCDTTLEIVILSDPTFEASLNFNNQFCAGSSGSIQASVTNGSAPYSLMVDGMNYTFMGTDTTIEWSQTGSFTVILADANGCRLTETSSFQVSDSIVIHIDTTLCIGSSISIGGENFDENNPTGQVIINNPSGCDSTINVSLRFIEESVEFESVAPNCLSNENTKLAITDYVGEFPLLLNIEGEQITITSLPFEYELSNLGANNFSFESPSGCLSNESYMIIAEAPDEIELDIEEISEITVGDSVLLIGNTSVPLSSIQWTPNIDLSCDSCITTYASPEMNTTYTLNVESENGCFGEALITVIVLPNEERESLFIPNIFSPNNDGVNDYFTMYGPQDYNGFIRSLRIFDRWGNQLFSRENIPLNEESLGWDGSANGQALKPAVFAYSIELITSSGRLRTFKGTVTLVK